MFSSIRRIQRTLIHNHKIDLLQARSIKLWQRAEVEKFILFNFNMKLRNIWVLKRSSWLQRTLENFPSIFLSRCWYLRCSPRPDASNAQSFVTIRWIERELRAQNDGNLGKSIFSSSKWDLEISGFCHFLAKFLTSNGCRKFLTHFLVTLWVCKIISWIISIQRTLNHGQTTHQSFFIWNSFNPPQ